LVSLGVYEYLHDALDRQEPTRPMRGLWKIGRSAGWIVPHTQVCWISERPRILQTDDGTPSGCSIVHGGPDAFPGVCRPAVQIF
jgi:hypothetical protein